MSLTEKCELWGVTPALVKTLQEMEFDKFFSIQEDVVPLLMQQNSNPVIIPRDIYVSSPTGSGKTLCYALPVVDYFLKNHFADIHRLRCLVLLPSRELAVQVHSFFERLVEGTGVKVSLTVGGGESDEERRAENYLLDDMKNQGEPQSFSLLRKWDSKKSRGAASETLSTDILVSTTGKLMDHLILTPGFTLKDLRFLILDEADRLLDSGYHGWVRSLLTSVDSVRSGGDDKSDQRKRKFSTLDVTLPLQRLLFSATATDDPKALALLGVHHPVFIYNREAALVAKDRMSEADVVKRDVFVLPATLLERRMTVTTENKLFKLLVLLVAAFSSNSALSPDQDYSGCCAGSPAACIVFVSSVDASHRLSTLLQLVNGQFSDKDVSSVYNSRVKKQIGTGRLFPGTVEEMTRLVRPEERERVINGAKSGEVSIIVSSDRMARGMDVSNLQLVVNYEVPKQATTYVHRAGRTARAGRTGRCLTLVKEGQYKDFQRVSGEIRRSEPDAATSTAEHPSVAEDVRSMQAYRVPSELEDILQPLYDAAVGKLSSYLS